MGDMMSTGLSGLLAFRRALDTTGHNIANANTDGYSRQRVEFGTREATQLGSGYLGNGVKVLTVRRSVDEFLTMQARSSASGLERLQAFASQAERINNLFSDGANGLAASMQRFANAIEGAASNPSSLAARQVLLETPRSGSHSRAGRSAPRDGGRRLGNSGPWSSAAVPSIPEPKACCAARPRTGCTAVPPWPCRHPPCP